MTYCVSFRHVVKRYGSETVIDDVDIDLPADCTTALVGESGSGKSTLLQLINGLVRPDAGAVELFGEPLDYANLPAARRRMGYAVQGAGLFPHLTVRQNVTLVAELEGWEAGRIDRRFDELLRLLELDPAFAPRYHHSLSGGQQQRVSLCRAMMLNPPLMLLDEPFSALDPITRRSIHDEFLTLQRTEPRSTVLVTHDMSEAVKLAAHLVIIRAGRIEQAGTLEAVRAAPVNDYVQSLFEGALA